VTSSHERSAHALLSDDALVVRADVALAELVEPLLPLHAAPPTRHEPRATIEVVAHEPSWAGRRTTATEASGYYDQGVRAWGLRPQGPTPTSEPNV